MFLDFHFKKEIFETDWNFVFNAESANEKYNAFEEKYREIYDRCFPQKDNKKKKRKVEKPWILPWLQGACDRKNKFYFDYVTEVCDLTKAHAKVKYDKYDQFVR